MPEALLCPVVPLPQPHFSGYSVLLMRGSYPSHDLPLVRRQIVFRLDQPSTRLALAENGTLTTRARFTDYTSLTVRVVVTEDNPNCFDKPGGTHTAALHWPAAYLCFHRRYLGDSCMRTTAY